MMNVVGLPKKIWAEAVATAVYILNISPTKAVLNQTPYEAWKGRKPRVSHLKIFGCIAYALDNSHSRRKLDVKSTKCIFVGYSPQSKAYKLYKNQTPPCFKVCHAHLQSKDFMLSSWKRFCENICNLFVCAAITQSYYFICNQSLNEIIMNVYMLCSAVKC